MLRFHTTSFVMLLFRRSAVCLALAGLASITLPLPAQSPAKPQKTKPAKPAFSGSDVMATVNGRPITRRELTYFWVGTDPQAAHTLGDLLADRIRTDHGRSSSYSLSTTAIYARLYSDPLTNGTPYAGILSDLITNHLLEMEAKRQGIIITTTEALQEAHRMFDQVRTQRGLKLTDEQIMVKFHVPRDIFLDDMMFRLRTERLFAADIARHNGHPIGPDDWIVVRELFASAEGANDDKTTEQRFVDARSRLESWVNEIKGGKSMADVASEHNEDATKSAGGLINPALRGTGTRSIEDAIFALKPGELSAPLRGKNGWYVFRVERRGSQISAQERQAMWITLVETKRPQFLAALRRSAKITSVVPLPRVESAPDASASAAEMPPAPPTVPVQ